MVLVTRIIIWAAYIIALYLLIFWLLVYLEKGISTTKRQLRKFPKVTITIPAYNEEDTIEGTITSVLNLDYPKDKLEIFVVNDGSVDKTQDIVQDVIAKNLSYDIQLINQENRGKGSALNQGLQRASGSIFFCLDADSIVTKDALKDLLPYFDNEKVASVLPLMKIKNPTTILQKMQWAEYLLNYFYKRLMGMLDCVHVAPGPFSAYRTDIIKKIGYFDENNLTEDLEMALRLQKHNYKIRQILDATVFTYAPKTFNKFYKQRNRWYKGTVLNMFKYKDMIFNRKYGDFGMLQMPRVAFAGVIAIVMVFVSFVNYVIIPLSKRLHDLAFINFDIISRLDNFITTTKLIDLNVTNLFFAVVLTSLGLVTVKLAYKYTREKIFKRGYLLALPAYYILYAALSSFVWLSVFIELLLGKQQRW